MTFNEKLCKNTTLKFEAYVFDICYNCLIEAILTNIQNMFYEEIKIKQGPSYISFCPLRILYNSKFILMATSLGTNAIVIKRDHCIRSFSHVVHPVS